MEEEKAMRCEARRTLSIVEESRAWSEPWRRRTSASSATARRRSASSSAARVATRAAAASRSSRAASAAADAAASRPRASPSPDIGWRGAVERWGPALRPARRACVRATEEEQRLERSWIYKKDDVPV